MELDEENIQIKVWRLSPTLYESQTRITYISFGVKFYQELFPLEAQFSNFGPGEGVDLGGALEDQNTEVGHRQAKSDAFVVL